MGLGWGAYGWSGGGFGGGLRNLWSLPALLIRRSRVFVCRTCGSVLVESTPLKVHPPPGAALGGAPPLSASSRATRRGGGFSGRGTAARWAGQGRGAGGL